MRSKAVSLKDPSSQSNWLYFAKPQESFCKENMKFALKHLKMFQYSSGLHTLINEEAMHDTYYKHLRFDLQKNSQGSVFTISAAYVV